MVLGRGINKSSSRSTAGAGARAGDLSLREALGVLERIRAVLRLRAWGKRDLARHCVAVAQALAEGRTTPEIMTLASRAAAEGRLVGGRLDISELLGQAGRRDREFRELECWARGMDRVYAGLDDRARQEIDAQAEKWLAAELGPALTLLEMVPGLRLWARRRFTEMLAEGGGEDGTGTGQRGVHPGVERRRRRATAK